ncbi:rhomboid family intramembrane serine protease, partial [Streptomyces anthocyanicus]|uniref:rhomboid family intramembrane serine protease n=1 Tax=Streptomyces anthocyanicus TaxID=68174 RepID=UPI00336A0BE1
EPLSWVGPRWVESRPENCLGSVKVPLLPQLGPLGASGAIFGLFGATAALVRRLNADMRPVVILLVISLIFTFTRGNISWQAHVGGLVAGAVIGYAMLHAPRERRTLVQYGTCALVLLVVVGLTLLRSAQLT